MATLAAAAAPPQRQQQQQQQVNARASAVVVEESDNASPSSIGVDRNHRQRRRKPDAFDDERFDAVAFVNEMFPTGASF